MVQVRDQLQDRDMGKPNLAAGRFDVAVVNGKLTLVITSQTDDQFESPGASPGRHLFCASCASMKRRNSPRCSRPETLMRHHMMNFGARSRSRIDLQIEEQLCEMHLIG